MADMRNSRWYIPVITLAVLTVTVIHLLDAKSMTFNDDGNGHSRLYLTAENYYKASSRLHHLADGRSKISKDEEAPPSPDSLPLVAVFPKTKDIGSNIFIANRYSGVEPFEGDMLLDKVDKELIRRSMGRDKVGKKRNSGRDRRKLWLPNGKTVPYIIDPSRMDATKQIKKAMSFIESVSCVKFRPKIPSDNNWLRIFKGIGCFSDIGRSYYMKGRATEVSLGSTCIQHGLILHELMHSLGFFHEQSRADRNSHIKFNIENVRKGKEDQFELYDSYEADTSDTEYDYSSLMQYGNTAFTANGKNTMENIYDLNMKLGGKTLSESDIIRLNKIYDCTSTSKDWTGWSSWGPCQQIQNECVRRRDRMCLAEDKSKCKGFQLDDYNVQVEKEICKLAVCEAARNGHWGVWSEWEQCSASCDEGTRLRKRECNNPVPNAHGKKCKGRTEHSKVCKIKSCTTNGLDTSFEDGWGIWRQGTEDDFDWQRGSGGTPTARTGPKKDHTTGFGYYAYVEGSPPRLPGEISRLISQPLAANSPERCFMFYYIMKGKHIGHLDLHIRTKSGKTYKLWRKNGHQGPDWYNGAVSLPTLAEESSLVFEAKIGNGELSDIALDDVYFEKGRCPLEEQGCENHDSMCEDWASQGECDNNQQWMTTSCCKACLEKGSCKDDPGKQYKKKRKKCMEWAKKNQCMDNAEWMKKHCCRTCNGCLDSSPECQKWAKNGECTAKNKVWMEENCSTSCNYCRSSIA